MTKPSVENIASATAYTSTQLMKLGMVIRVWMVREKRLLLNSLSMMASAMGTQEVRMPKPLMARVFFMTRRMSARVAA